MQYTAAQLKALEVPKPPRDTCIVAGPGSGKTAVLVGHFVRLVEADVSPLRILAITFTEKAANEMKTRLAHAFKGRADLRSQIEHAYVSTIDGFCARLLREHAISAGVDPEFRILDEWQSAAMQLEAAREGLDQLFNQQPERVTALLRATASTELAKAMLGIYDAIRAAGVSELVAPVSDSYDRERETLLEAFHRFESLYRQRKSAAAALDYADLCNLAVRLLEQDTEAREDTRKQFDYVLMDEFQDTNPLQAKLLALIRQPDRFYAVGDINQSIYGFRHADPEVFTTYRRQVQESGRRVVELRENWRSRADILAAVETLFRDSQGIEAHRLHAERAFAFKAEPSVEIISAIAPDKASAEWLEGRWVARRILDLVGQLEIGEPGNQRPAAFGDVAVLVRNSSSIEAFTQAFDAVRIPYIVTGGKGYFEAREVNDLIHYLRVLVNRRDEISMAAVLRSPLAGVSDETLLRLKQHGNLGAVLGRLEHMDTSAFDPDELAKLRRFSATLAQARQERDYTPADVLLMRVMDTAGYELELSPRGRANVEKLLEMLRASGGQERLPDLLDRLALLRAGSPRQPEASPEDATGAVRIMTAHAAKGLEFPIVFLAALHKGVSERSGPLCFSPSIGLGARWRNPETNEEEEDWPYQRISEQRNKKDAEENDRLFYVATTRAQEHLVLSCSNNGKTLRKWARKLRDAFGIDLRTPAGSAWTEPIRAPDGTEFPLRVLCTDLAPDFTTPVISVRSPEPVRIVERAPATPQHDSIASVTSVVQFAQCPRRYYLARYLSWDGDRGKPPDEEEDFADMDEEELLDLDAGEFGKQVHSLLAGNTVENPHPDALRLRDRFHHSEFGRKAATATTVEREYDFLLSLENIVLRGQIDLWFESDGELILVDYKTDEVEEAAAPQHAQTHALQLRLYALALERAIGRPPTQALVYLLRPDITIPLALDRPLLEEAAAVVKAFRQAQESRSFPLNEGVHCRKCLFFKRLCPAQSVSAQFSLFEK